MGNHLAQVFGDESWREDNLAAGQVAVHQSVNGLS
jgi:hypothetical protein